MTDDYEWDIDYSDFMLKTGFIESAVHMAGDIALDNMLQHIEETTWPLVPFKEGYLESGFNFYIYDDWPEKKICMYYSAINNRGQDYAAIQHEGDYEHPIRKPGKDPQQYYFIEGLDASQWDYEDIIVRALWVVW